MMTNQTYDYIALKPIAERFKNIANSISDEEIKAIIIDELRNQIKEQVSFGFIVSEIVDSWVENNEDYIKTCVMNCVTNRLDQGKKMTEYIERNVLYEMLHEAGGCDAPKESWAAGYNDGIDTAINLLLKAPTADVAPMQHGRWKLTGFDGIVSAVKCNRCGYGAESCDERE